jgi:transposase
MATRTFILTQSQSAELRQAHDRSKDGPTRTRLQAVRLYGSAYPLAQVQEIAGCSRTALMDWTRRYRSHGVAGLADRRLGGNRAKLTPPQRQTVHAYLQQYTPRQLFGPDAATADGQFWTVPDLKRAVKMWFGVAWSSLTSYISLLNDGNFSYQRTQKVYKSRREADVMVFDEVLEQN